MPEYITTPDGVTHEIPDEVIAKPGRDAIAAFCQPLIDAATAKPAGKAPRTPPPAPPSTSTE